MQWCFLSFSPEGHPRRAGPWPSTDTAHYPSCSWATPRLHERDLSMAHGGVLSKHTHTRPHAHTLDLLTLEHVAKCVLMRNSWFGSAQIKDIPVRELSPVLPSCSAASKWVLLSLTPAALLEPCNHAPRASNLPRVDRHLVPRPHIISRHQGMQQLRVSSYLSLLFFLTIPQIGSS